MSRPVMVCPAMNTNMWTHPLTQQHLNILKETLGWHVVGPVCKRLACGDIGKLNEVIGCRVY
jgi:phosphopantothenoylcysteine decarboxylase